MVINQHVHLAVSSTYLSNGQWAESNRPPITHRGARKTLETVGLNRTHAGTHARLQKRTHENTYGAEERHTSPFLPPTTTLGRGLTGPEARGGCREWRRREDERASTSGPLTTKRLKRSKMFPLDGQAPSLWRLGSSCWTGAPKATKPQYKPSLFLRKPTSHSAWCEKLMEKFLTQLYGNVCQVNVNGQSLLKGR